jgi:hypothetical protein
MTDEEFRAIIAAGPAVVMVESRHMIALLDERDELRAENARLRALLDEAADTLEEYASDEYLHRDKYPSEMHRYKRAMEFPSSIRAALEAKP